MTTDHDWVQRIAELVTVKQRLGEVGRGNVWEIRFPAVAAEEAHVVDVEGELGEKLNSQYREFLLHADGWPAFYQAVDLLGTGDLSGGSDRGTRARNTLSYIEDAALEESGLRRADLIPIAVSSTDQDLFVILRESSTTPGVVVWFAGAEVDRFPTFSEYFLAMIDYNRNEVAYFEARS